MVKMRVKENASGCGAEIYINQIIDVELTDDGLLFKDSYGHLFFKSELEPVEESARPTQEDKVTLPNGIDIINTKSEGPPTPTIVLNGERGIRYTKDGEIDQVLNPEHYCFSEYEPIKVIQAWDLSFALGNVVKYIARAGRKDSSKLIEDLEKAKRYLELELVHLRKE